MIEDVTEEEVRAYVVKFWDYWNSFDADKIVQVYTGGHGFGYRTRPPRTPYGEKVDYRPMVAAWIDSMDHNHMLLGEFSVTAYRNIGVAWGLYREAYQLKGQEEVILDGRFSQMFAKEGDEWKMLFYHRDMTPFDGENKFILPPGARQGGGSNVA